MSVDPDTYQTGSVLDAAFVESAINDLKPQAIHEHFFGYLYLCRQASLGDRGDIQPNWKGLLPYLHLPTERTDVTHARPYYRPISLRNIRDESVYWVSNHMAGSFSPSSIRNSFGFVLDEDRRFTLPTDHAKLARNALLREERISVFPVAAYLLRNALFDFPGGNDSATLLIDAFFEHFGFGRLPEGESAFDELFHTDNRPDDDAVFVPWTEMAPLEETDSPIRGFRPPVTAEEVHVPLPRSATQPVALDATLEETANDDPFVLKIERLLGQYGGVLLTGPPGTSKSMRADEVARSITSQPEDRDFVQFHASYQYEDFMVGYVPDPETKGFKERRGVFLQACDRATMISPKKFVLVIDEFSRADVGRVFGEALTYIERSKRGKPFKIASGSTETVPANLLIVATMNPYDRGVDEVDAAFERRFAKISMEPDRETLESILTTNELDLEIRDRVLGWFSHMIKLSRDNPLAAVGHAYFSRVTDVESLREVWEHQLVHYVSRAFRNNPEMRDQVVAKWRSIFRDVPGGWDGDTFHLASEVPADNDA